MTTLAQFEFRGVGGGDAAYTDRTKRSPPSSAETEITPTFREMDE